jgi:putative copper resistance protein D
VDDWLHPLLRFAHYSVLLGLFGVTAFRAIRLRRLESATKVFGASTGLVAAAVLAPLLSACLMLTGIAAMMGQPLGALAWPTVAAILTGTDIGQAFAVRAALLTLAAAALLANGRGRPANGIAALLFGCALATLPWSGHAAATEGVAGVIHRSSDALHLLAAGLWIGAICWFLRLTLIAHRHPEVMPPAALLSILHGFAPFGAALVTVVSLTGLVNAQAIFGLANTREILDTAYGTMLAAKIALVGAMLAFSARNALFVRENPTLAQSSPPETATLSALRRSLAAELILAAFVIALVAVIGIAAPMGG